MLRPGKLLLIPALLLALSVGASAGKPLRINGSTTVNPVVAEAAELLRAERGLTIHVDTQGGSSGGIAALVEGRAEVAMISRELDEEDRRRHPGARFQVVEIGLDAVALVVSRDVWESGVRNLSKEQVRGIYEGRIKSWKPLGGADRRLVFFNKEPGRGTWEVFAKWLYGSPKAAPLVSHLEVGANEEARNKVAGTPGSLSQLSAAWADGTKVFALGIRLDGGRVVLPNAEAIRNGSYPIARRLSVVTDGLPAGDARALIDLLLSPRGQALVAKHGYLPIAAQGAGR
jgi:phosphate transport system substrate-binding protein